MKRYKLHVDPVIREKIFGAIDERKRETVDFLKLVQTSSVFGEEGPAQCIIDEKMEELGLDLDVFEVDQEQMQKHPEYSHAHTSLETTERPSSYLALLKGRLWHPFFEAKEKMDVSIILS